MSGYNAYTAKELKDVILRRLGAPIVNVEVTPDQIYDCIQRSLELFGEYHFNGLNKAYSVFYIPTPEEKDKMDESVYNMHTKGLFNLFDKGVFAITQIVRTNVGSITSMDGQATYPWFTDFLLGMAGINGGMGSSCSKFYGPNAFGADLGYFTQLMQYHSMMQDLISPLPDYWFNDNTGQLKIMGNFMAGDLVIVECFVKSFVAVEKTLGNIVGYGIAGPQADNTYEEIYNNPDMILTGQRAGEDMPIKQGSYNNRWVKDYSTALVKELNGQILAKHQGMLLPGGITVDGTRLIEEAQREKEALRNELELLDPPFGILIG
ncbi:neck protein [Erwinia phage FBB1]|nr:neck protein [Erwinia phage FBB1]